MMRGKFVVFEGGDGAGKDTQIDLLKQELPDALYTREPGGTPLGKELRKLLLDGEDISVTAEALLFLADRAQHMEEIVAPALVSGTNVISNRSRYTLVAYQVYGRNCHDLKPLIDVAHEYIYREYTPDLIIWLDLEAKEGLRRAEGRGDRNRIDRAPLDVHERIRQGFVEQFYGMKNVAKIDASRSIEEVQADVRAALVKEGILKP